MGRNARLWARRVRHVIVTHVIIGRKQNIANCLVGIFFLDHLFYDGYRYGVVPWYDILCIVEVFRDNNGHNRRDANLWFDGCFPGGFGFGLFGFWACHGLLICMRCVICFGLGCGCGFRGRGGLGCMCGFRHRCIGNLVCSVCLRDII